MIAAGTKRRAAGALHAACVLCALVGCKSIVGIKERRFDAKLADSGVQASSGHGGSTGRSDGGNPTRADTGVDRDDEDATTGSISSDAGPKVPLSPCEIYCTTVMKNCTDQYAVYASPQLCMAVCAKLPLGDMGESNPLGNSVACRSEQARLAGVTREPWDHCPRSGPGGSGVCGENCESYCMLDAEFCPDDTDPDCLTKCPALRDLDDEKRNFDDSTFDVVKHHDGDYLQCRLVHVSSASVAPLAHCWHAALAPFTIPDASESNPCADPPMSAPRCEDYCRLNTHICDGDFAQYESEAQCLKLCASFDPGTSGEKGGQNTLGCRKAHSYNALLGGADTHCPHSGPGGHSVCGSNCESYCREVKAACAAPYAEKFADDAACISECEGLADHDDPYTIAAGKAKDRQYACRLLNTARAAESTSSCPAALGGGACQ